MKYFPYELIARSNGWIEESPQSVRSATARFERAMTAYKRHLDRIRPRMSIAAWHFFRHDNSNESLHDGRLLKLLVGNSPHLDGKAPQNVHLSRTNAILEFWACDETIVTFECKDIRKMKVDLGTEEPNFRDPGDLYIYEMRAVNHEFLAVGFLFASGSEIEVEFKRLIFRRRSAKHIHIAP
jgi:hypothetical protein